MLSAASLSVHSSPKTPIHSPKLTCVKTLSESPGLTHIPTSYAYFTNPKEFAASEPEDLSIPIIDFSLLTSGDPNCRTQIIQDLGKACEKWGFFMVCHPMSMYMINSTSTQYALLSMFFFFLKVIECAHTLPNTSTLEFVVHVIRVQFPIAIEESNQRKRKEKSNQIMIQYLI